MRMSGRRFLKGKTMIILRRRKIRQIETIKYIGGETDKPLKGKSLFIYMCHKVTVRVEKKLKTQTGRKTCCHLKKNQISGKRSTSELISTGVTPKNQRSIFRERLCPLVKRVQW